MPILWILHGLVTPALLVLLVQVARPRENGLRTTAAAARRLLTTRGGRLVLLSALAILGLNFAECLFDEELTARLGYSLAPRIRTLEGDLVERVQALTPEVLIPPLALVYVSGYVAWLLAPAVLFAVADDRETVAGLLLAFLANYALALPFYLFFPVEEPAFSGVSDAIPLVERVWPGLTAEMRVGSALDNCFPSLHVSCSLATLWFAWRRGGTALRIVGVLMFASIVLSTLALGIHWGIDIAAGIAFGFLCAFVGEDLAGRALRWMDA